MRRLGIRDDAKISEISENQDFQWWIVESDLDYQEFLQKQEPAPKPPVPAAVTPAESSPLPNPPPQGEGIEGGQGGGTGGGDATSPVSQPADILPSPGEEGGTPEPVVEAAAEEIPPAE